MPITTILAGVVVDLSHSTSFFSTAGAVARSPAVAASAPSPAAAAPAAAGSSA
ncbi:MAG: dihydrolipoamide succinyltransferase, partial [Planctomycetes bacterium]|nr:dihydrolipoamide succinyltransferase [Planctomycetota bacterium]